MNHNPGRTTLFLHEDVVERTLAYERELREWRIAEIKAGRTDPGRPTYDQVSGGGLKLLISCLISALGVWRRESNRTSLLL